jgi:hypothetical protein
MQSLERQEVAGHVPYFQAKGGAGGQSFNDPSDTRST